MDECDDDRLAEAEAEAWFNKPSLALPAYCCCCCRDEWEDDRLTDMVVVVDELCSGLRLR